MTIELWVLVYAALWGFVQLMIATAAPMRQPGFIDWVKSNRETPYVPTGKAGAAQRAYRNFMETFVFFAVAVTALAFAHKSSSLSVWGAHIYLFARLIYLPTYVYLPTFIRTPVWMVSIVGMVLCYWALFT